MRYMFLRFPEGKDKAVTFSFDDGKLYDIKLREIMDKHGIKGTFNIVPDWIENFNDGSNVSYSQYKEQFLPNGHEIALHTRQHLASGRTTPARGIKSVLECREMLEKEFGMIITGMAYPDSGITYKSVLSDYPAIRQYLIDLGISYSRSLGADNDNFMLPTDWYNWIPTAHIKNPNLFEYIDKFFEPMPPYIASREAKLFYLWGHSYEFEQDLGWDSAEKICAALGDRDDVWYATNMQIHDYIEAYKGLVFSMDDTLCYNPSLIDVWIALEDKTVKIPSGQTVNL